MRTKIFSSKILNISPAATIVVADKANELKSKGIDVISFATGEPDFDTPQNIKDSANRAMKEGFTKYTTVSGIKELKKAICKKFKRENYIEYEPSNILVSNGAKQALYNAFLTICDQGDEVLLPTPCYVSFKEQIKLAGAEPVFVPTEEENNFRLTLNGIKRKFNKKTKALLINSPNNPSGSICRKEDLEQIANFVIENELWVITDEIYENLLYDNNEHISIASINENIQKRTITVNGVSKTYAMTGWRLGYAAAPKEIISAMAKLQGHVTGNVNSIAQRAAIEALDGPQEVIETMRNEYNKRRDYMVNELNSMKGIYCNKPDGAFYTFPNISKVYGTKYKDKEIKNEADFVNYILDEAHVAIVPGKAFEYPDHIRLSFALSMESIKKGIERIKKAVNNLN